MVFLLSVKEEFVVAVDICSGWLVVVVVSLLLFELKFVFVGLGLECLGWLIESIQAAFS